MKNPFMYNTPKRWVAVVSYHGGLDVTHYLDELEQLQSLIERGPNFYLVDNIAIKLNSDREGYAECRADALEQSDIPQVKI